MVFFSSTPLDSGVASQHFGGGQVLTLSEQQYFFVHRLSKHEMTRNVTNLGHGPPGCAYASGQSCGSGAPSQRFPATLIILRRVHVSCKVRCFRQFRLLVYLIEVCPHSRFC